MLQEADARASTGFVLRLDDLRERIAPSLEAIAKSEARIFRRNADTDDKGNPRLTDDTGKLRFSTIAQQEKVQDELSELYRLPFDLDPETLPRIKKTELMRNGLSTSGQRMANLRVILSTELDEPDVPQPETRSFIMTTPRGADA
jgi:hypothetical protein